MAYREIFNQMFKHLELFAVSLHQFNEAQKTRNTTIFVSVKNFLLSLEIQQMAFLSLTKFWDEILFIIEVTLK